MDTLHAILFVIFAAPLSVLHAGAPSTPPTKPNVIVIFSDDHGWADLGCQGVQRDVRTPNLDALATGGVRATNGYVTAPQCVPSRAGLLTGRYQNRFGVESNGVELGGFDSQLTIAERLKQAGYVTGMTGKWHLGPPPQITEHGFDDVYCNQGGPQAWANIDLDGNRVPAENVRSDVYHLDANTAAACGFVRQHKDQPFFFYLAYRAPHTPLDAPEKYTSRFPGQMPERRRRALAMISAIDDGVGRVMQTLREHGLEERTLVVFMGDNGAPLKIHKTDAPLNTAPGGWDGSLNAPMNGEKGMLSEGGIRVPWIAYWKGILPPGTVFEHPVISLDVAATAVALAGLPHEPKLDGTNLIPYFTGQEKAAPHDALFWRWIAQAAVREGKWKLLVGGRRQYLFNLEADPEEKNNLLAQRPEIAERLRARLEAWSADLQPPGLQTQPMAKTWEDYYDFYLDGKPAPSPNAESSATGTTQGWIARNSTLEVREGVLRVTPDKAGKQRPFIACAQLKIPGPSRATIRVRSTRGGRAGFAWRLDGQKDFPPEQVVSLDLPAAEDWQEIGAELPAQGQIIHLRILLPNGTTEIGRISLSGKNGSPTKQWSFDGR